MQRLRVRVPRVRVRQRRGEELLGELAEVLVAVDGARADERGSQRGGGRERLAHERGARGVFALEALLHAGLLQREGLALGGDAPQSLGGILLGEPEEAPGERVVVLLAGRRGHLALTF